MRLSSSLTIIAGLIALLHGNEAFAQSVQKVQVVEYMGSEVKKPLPDVSLAVQNAPTAMSREDGSLELQFRTLHAGDRVSLRRADKNGYEIFNREAVEQWNVSTTDVFRLVMCKSSMFRALCENYMQTASQSYERQYKKDQEHLAQLLKEKKIAQEQYEKQLAQLEGEYNEQLDNLDNYVERFARIDLESLSDDQRKIVQLIQDGHIDEAIAAFEAADYLALFKDENAERKRAEEASRQLNQIAEQKRRNEQQLIQAVLTQAEAYELAGGHQNYEKSYKLRKDLVEADTTNTQLIFQLVYFLGMQKRLDEAPYYANMLLRQPSAEAIEQMKCCHAMVALYGTLYMMEEARAWGDKGIVIGRQQIESGHASYAIRSYMMRLTLQIAQSYSIYLQYEKAEPYVAEAEKIVNQIEAEDSLNAEIIEYKTHIWEIKALCLLGREQYAVALNEIKACLDYIRPQLTSHPELFEIYSSSLTIASSACEGAEDFVQMQGFAQEYYDMVKPAYEQNPERGVDGMLLATGNLCVSHMGQNHLDQALDYILQCKSYLEQLEKLVRQPVYDYRFSIEKQFARIYDRKGDLKLAKDHARAAIDAYQSLEQSAQNDPEEELKDMKVLLDK